MRGVIKAGFPALLLLSSQAAAAPQSVKVSWASADAATTMAVSWVTPNDTPTTIEYGINATSENMLTGLAPDNVIGIGYYHQIELSGLLPDTTYRYRVGSNGDWSQEYTFKTAPNDQCTPFAFVQLGDARSQDDRGPSLNWSSIHSEAMAVGAQFFLNGGDLVKEGTEIEQWATWLADSDAVNPLIPMMPALGNHDDGPGDGNAANYNRIFTLPTNTVTGTEDYYYFVYNNLVVFSLSTQTFEDWAAQMAWMTNVAAMHPNKWKVAYFHHPVYTTQTRALGIEVGHEPNEKGQNPFYAPAFDQAGIDIVFQSHNHIYERFDPLRYDPNDVEQGRVVQNYGNGPNDGRLYVVSGGSGAFLDPLIEGQFQQLANGSASRSKDHHFMKIGIAGNTLQYSAIRTNAGNTSGGGTIIDQLTIQRPGPDPCDSPMDPDGDMDGYPASMDCDDTNPMINPGAAEICGNTVDEDCDGTAQDCPEPPVDMDMDGSPAGTDCDDNNPDRYPEHPEVECDGIDNDCDCNELCNGVETDVCNPSPRDGGVSTPPRDGGDTAVPPLPRDGGTASEDKPPQPIGDESCSCASTERPRGAPIGLLAVLLLWMRKRSRTSR